MQEGCQFLGIRLPDHTLLRLLVSVHMKVIALHHYRVIMV